MASKLARIHRVRTVQLNLMRAAESAAQSQFASERALRARIGQLAAGSAPQLADTDGVAFAAAALYRDRLQVSAQAAERRVADAEVRADRAVAAARAARQDQLAVEKLIDRDAAAAALAALRALETAPPARAVRHDPC